MKKFFSYIFMVLLLIPAAIFVGCNEEENPNNTPQTSVIATIDGFEVKSIRIFHVVDNYYNLEVGVKNTNTEDKVFDFSNIIVKRGSDTISHNGNEKDYTAGQYLKWSFQIDEGHNLSVGQEVDVYYGNEKLKTVVVVEF